jgi:ElaB/YqjD/DUF883 family membrane-anchored ribosome-binding protein
MRLRKLVDQAKAQVEGAATSGKQKLEETREKLQEKVEEAKTQAEEVATSGKQRLEETRDKVQDKVEEARTQVGEAASSGKQKLENTRDSLQDKVDETKTQASEMTVSGKQKLEETRDRLQIELQEKADLARQKADEIRQRAEKLIPEVKELEPILKSAGFVVSEIDVILSIAPGLTVIIDQTAYEPGSLDQALEKHQFVLTDLQKKAIQSLARASDFAAQMTVKYGYRATEYELTLLPPSVIVHFAPQESVKAPETAKPSA